MAGDEDEEIGTRLVTPEDRTAVDLPPFNPFRSSTPGPEETTVKVPIAELRILRADSAWAQRAHRILDRFKALPPALRRIADMIDELVGKDL